MFLTETNRIVLCVGFMGSFTTFSSLMFDSWTFLADKPILFIANLAAQLVLGLAALLAGMQVARLF